MLYTFYSVLVSFVSIMASSLNLESSDFLLFYTDFFAFEIVKQTKYPSVKKIVRKLPIPVMYSLSSNTVFSFFGFHFTYSIQLILPSLTLPLQSMDANKKRQIDTYVLTVRLVMQG